MVTKQVLFFRPTLADGGADRVTITLLQHLDRRRFTPTLALLRRSGVLADEIPKDVSVVELHTPRLSRSVVALARVISRLAPDVVACTAGGANVVCVAAHRLARSRARLVLSERSVLLRGDRSPARRLAETQLKRLAYRYADLVTAVSQGVADDLSRVLHLERTRIAVVHNPVVSDDLFQLASEPVEHPFFDGTAPVALAVGRLVAVKEYPTLLRAFARMREHTTVRLAILGEGPLRDQLEATAGALGISEHVAFLGYDKNPYRYMQRAVVLLQASSAEGLPAVLVQSLACGTPVVATDCDHGPREVVRQGVDGFLVPVGDHRGLAERALSVMSDPQLRARLSAAGRMYSNRFSVHASIEKYESALEGG